MGLLDNVLGTIGYIRLSDGSSFYKVRRNSTSFLNGTDKLKIARENPVISACIEIRAKLLSQVQFYIEGKDGEKITDDDIIKLIENPNAHQSKQDFLKQYEWYKSSYGWVYQKPYGAVGYTPSSIFNLKSSSILFPNKLKSSMVWTDDEIRQFYEQEFVYKENNQKKSIELNSIIPFYDITNGINDDKTNIITSTSRIDSIIKQASNINLASDAENVMIQTNGRELFSGGSTKGANLGASMPLNTDDKKEIEGKLINGYGLGYGRKRAITTNNAVTWQSLHIKLKDLGLHESITSNANIVTGAYEVPNEIYKAFMKGSTFENQKEALIGFIQNTIQPIADDLANSWTAHFGYQDKPIKASFDHLPVMQHTEDKKADKILKIASAYEKLVRAGLSEKDVHALMQNQGITINDEE